MRLLNDGISPNSPNWENLVPNRDSACVNQSFRIWVANCSLESTHRQRVSRNRPEQSISSRSNRFISENPVEPNEKSDWTNSGKAEQLSIDV